MPTMTTLKTYACKIYRKNVMSVGNSNQSAIPTSFIPSAAASHITYEWKRKCFGRIKFISV